MSSDILDLTGFYQTPLGVMTREKISDVLQMTEAKGAQGDFIAGFGYAPPYLEALETEGVKQIAVMPGFQGACRWPRQKNAAVLVNENELPFEDECFNKILCVHMLEHVGDARAFLTEACRVLSPSGEMIFIVPNRRGLWAQMENTPFGWGRPYTGRQLQTLIRQHNLFITHFETALFFPPRNPPPWRARHNIYNLYERVCRYLFARFAGVHIVKAVKRVYISPDISRSASVRARVLTAVGAARGGAPKPVG